MQNIQTISLREGSNEELLPNFSADFPYISTCAQLDKYLDPTIPWHWHNTVELFYMESGCLEYVTPSGKFTFPAGSGGFVNANILHTSRITQSRDPNIQLLHLFDPALLSGEHGSRMETKYILPLTTSPCVEMIPLYPEDPAQAELLRLILQAFQLSDQEWGYEFRLRHQLTEIWLKLYALARHTMERQTGSHSTDDKVKAMMIHIHEHFQDPITVDELAGAAHVSRRVCFRLFRENLHMTPVEYMRSFRLRKACQMLTESRESITQIAYLCGLGSSSYFGKIFRERFGCSPAEYRRQWHDRDRNRHR